MPPFFYNNVILNIYPLFLLSQKKATNALIFMRELVAKYAYAFKLYSLDYSFLSRFQGNGKISVSFHIEMVSSKISEEILRTKSPC